MWLLLSACGPNAAGVSEVPNSSPQDAVEAILDLFETYSIVALGEGPHTNLPGATMRLDLLRHPRFLDTVDDIVVEWGSISGQEVMDRYVNGLPVSREELESVWRNSTQSIIWEVPIYEEFFAAVRERNLAHPPEKRVRILFGDPALDWSSFMEGITWDDRESVWTESAINLTGAKDYEDFRERFGDVVTRDLNAHDVIVREVLAANRKALLIYGDMHFAREQLNFNFNTHSEFGGSLYELLERSHPGQTFSITSYLPSNSAYSNDSLGVATLVDLHPEILNWRRNSFISLEGTEIGRSDFRSKYPWPVPRIDPKTGNRIPEEKYESRTLADIFDGLIWLGSEEMASAQSQILPEAVADDDTYQELLRRLTFEREPEIVNRLRERYLISQRGIVDPGPKQ